MSPAIPLHELLRLCLRKGDNDDWEELVRRVQPLIAKTAWRVASSSGAVRSEDIDDIVQETCLKLSGSRAEIVAKAALENEAAASSYIRVMALNTARDHFGRERRRPATRECELAAPLDQLAQGVEPGGDWEVLLSEIDSALDTDSRSRSVFWLYFLRGYSTKEISEIRSVCLSSKGVQSLVSRLADSVQRKFAQKLKGKPASEAS
jgi:RNA polymerase sigma-70 factor (ECF subfamily)